MNSLQPEDTLELTWRLEKSWQESLRESLPRTDLDIIQTFCPDRQTILDKLHTWEEKREALIENFNLKKIAIKTKSRREDRGFWFEVLKNFDEKSLQEAEKHITRLRRLLFTMRGSPTNSKGVSQEMIQTALTVPITTYLDKPQRTVGNKISYHCPFHNERTPSFTVYTENNSFYCYGCGSGGNVINLVQRLYNFDFIKAVKHITQT